MRIVIDLQGAQTESRFRGIGRYSLSFAQGIARNRGNHEVFIVLNGLFTDTILTIRQAFHGLIPDQNILVWHASGPVHEIDSGNTWRRQAAEIIREAFIARLKPDIVHISSLFEGYIDDAVTSIGKYDQHTTVSVSLYDLIPLLNPDQYLTPNPGYKSYYLGKIAHLEKSAIGLAISEFSRNEALSHLQQKGMDIVNVSTAIDSMFQVLPVDADRQATLREKFGIAKEFVLYTGGADSRKNLPRLIDAFARLPVELRNKYQLVFAGKISPGELGILQQHCRNTKPGNANTVFTGYVTDQELVELYNLCTLFVFPSWHEGFGLPALEAMSCGAPTIAANTSSLPEVVALDEALFDPFNIDSITASIQKGLSDPAFRMQLREHGLIQSQRFSWDNTARTAIATFEKHAVKASASLHGVTPGKPRLALVTPVPPARSGIADYNDILIPALLQHYEVFLVLEQDIPTGISVLAHVAGIYTTNDFRNKTHEFDRIVYHVGNSPFHHHMLDLLREFPGIVVLHDFYLSSLMQWMETHLGIPGLWRQSLYQSHGYIAVKDDVIHGPEYTRQKYPANFAPIADAVGIMVHSEHSRSLMVRWYGEDIARNVEKVPMVRQAAPLPDKTHCRKILGLPDDLFLVCSFGFLDPSKLNHKLVNAWRESNLGTAAECRLVFVGENHGGEYGQDLLKAIRNSGTIDITGYVDSARFELYLGAADMAVQLRTSSRGETSAAVYDCMNSGLPTIVNANGAMAEIDESAVWMLPDDFEESELITALQTLRNDAHRRQAMATRAHNIVINQNSPPVCAAHYHALIEKFYATRSGSRQDVIKAIGALENPPKEDGEILEVARAMAISMSPRMPKRRLLIDITATCHNDLKTGIERVARALVLALLENPMQDFRIEPVYLSKVKHGWCYRYASRYTLALLGCPSDSLADSVVDPLHGDILLGLDLAGDTLIQAEESGLHARFRQAGVKIFFMVHDLLPVRMPEHFPPGADQSHTQWLKAICRMDGVIAVSKQVADDFSLWRKQQGEISRFPLAWSHHGADVANSAPSTGFPADARQMLTTLSERPTFLMVGTIEPRKGHLQVLEAFSRLWEQGVAVNLVVLGKEGWTALPDSMRRTIPEIALRLRKHPQAGHQLFWLQGVSDEYLEQLYKIGSCLLAASEGEGLGLPLIEAAQHKLPILARDIPVFREVAGSYATYFQATTSTSLAEEIKQWLAQFETGNHIRPDPMHWLTWAQSAENLKGILQSFLKFGEDS